MKCCLYCGSTTRKLGKEHLVPKSRGGTSVDGNVFLACQPCNASKGNRLPSEWRANLPGEVYELERVAIALHANHLRPRKVKVYLKNKAINVRCTKQQKRMLEAISASQGLGVSTWLLQLGLRVAQDRKPESVR